MEGSCHRAGRQPGGHQGDRCHRSSGACAGWTLRGSCRCTWWARLPAGLTACTHKSIHNSCAVQRPHALALGHANIPDIVIPFVHTHFTCWACSELPSVRRWLPPCAHDFLSCIAGRMAAPEAAGAPVDSKDVELSNKPDRSADTPVRVSPGAPLAALSCSCRLDLAEQRNALSRDAPAAHIASQCCRTEHPCRSCVSADPASIRIHCLQAGQARWCRPLGPQLPSMLRPGSQEGGLRGPSAWAPLWQMPQLPRAQAVVGR